MDGTHTGKTALCRGRARPNQPYGVYLAHVLVLHAVLDRILGRPATLVDAPATALAAMVGEWAVCLVLTWGLVRGVARVPSLAPLVGDRALTPPPPPP